MVAGGEQPVPAHLVGLPPGAVVIAADRGVAHAERLGLTVTLAVGDFDSVPADALDRAVAAGTEVRRYPAEKNATGLELALDAAAEYGPEQLIVLGGHGGRLDHQFANLLLLASPRYARLHIRARMDGASLTVVHQAATLSGAPGEVVSLLPLHGAAMGVETSGLRYRLKGEALAAGDSRGVSNQFVRPKARIRLRSGVLMAIQPASSSQTAPPLAE